MTGGLDVSLSAIDAVEASVAGKHFIECVLNR